MGTVADDKAFSAHLAEILKALAHPIRLRIVDALCDGDANVGELAVKLGVRQAILSQQLRILRMGGLVEAERENGFASYRLAEPRLKGLVRCLEKCPRK
jgi:DNA-binding transcriptional ArsR family regulator